MGLAGSGAGVPPGFGSQSQLRVRPHQPWVSTADRPGEAHQLIPDIPYYQEKAMIHATLGETDEAFRWLERAYERRGGRLYWFRLEPEFDALRSDTRYHGLLRRMGMEQRGEPMV